MIVLLSGNVEGTLTMVTVVIIAVLVAAGAGLRVFSLLKDKKVNTASLEELINSLYEDEELVDLLKTVFNDVTIFEESDDYEEFISNVKDAVNLKLYTYLNTYAVFIPKNLLKYATIENMSFITSSVLGYFGYDGAKLIEMFSDYLVGVITDSDELEKVDEDEVEELIDGAEDIKDL